MIPVSLSLNNFMCYRVEAPTLQLDGVPLACLCGPNGHGKSALLDAITWVLWGEARGRRQDQLVYQGEQEMQVTLVFDVQETRYRVMRRHARGTRSRQGTSSLELQVYSGDGPDGNSGEHFRPITGNSIGETQAKIQRLLNMNHDTFINSAFLVQGRADEFTRASPTHRKDVLAKVLGLGLYDRLEERAKSIAREQNVQARSLKLELEGLSQQMASKAEHQQALAWVQGQLAEVHTLVEARAKELEDMRRSVEHLRSRGEEADTLRRQVLDYQRQLSVLEDQASKRHVRLEEYQGKAQRGPLVERELLPVRAELEALHGQEEALSPRRDRLQDISKEVHRLRSENARLKQEMEELRTKVDLLEREGASPRCPLCNTELGPEGCQHLANSYETQGKEKARTHRENAAIIQRLEAEAQTLQGELSQAEEGLRRRRKEGEDRILALEKELHEATLAGELIATEADALALDGDMIRSRRAELEAALERKRAIEEMVRGLPTLEGQLQQKEHEHRELAERRESLLRQQGALEQQLRTIAQQEQAVKEKAERLKGVQQGVSIYEELGRAFGKSGVQALLIEATISRLEEEANRLLARMTDHRMTVKLETQRERRLRPEAEPLETLDIFIADELGTRDYQMFSGGEAFRINFALRIALSKLLAWRSGAPLPTLFIDEGFGTQDAAGREKILDVIRAIQDDFQRIIVITHMDEIKEAFPVRIEVSKGEGGATFTMN